MNLRDLEYFVAVAEYGHFGRAAQQCHVSQPTLSAQLKKLEQQLNVVLFERSHKHVMLTEAGQQLLPYARRVLAQTQEMSVLAEHLQQPLAGQLRLGLIPTIAPYLLPRITGALSQALPEVTWYFEERQTEAGIERLLQGELDALVLAKLHEVPHTLHLPLYYEPFWLAMPAKHPLAQQKTITLDAITHERILLLEEGHCLREQTESFCRWLVDQPQTFAGTSMETVRHMVAAGMGITVVPEYAVIPAENVTYRPFTVPQPGREVILLCRDTYPKMTLLKALQKVIRNDNKR